VKSNISFQGERRLDGSCFFTEDLRPGCFCYNSTWWRGRIH